MGKLRNRVTARPGYLSHDTFESGATPPHLRLGLELVARDQPADQLTAEGPVGTGLASPVSELFGIGLGEDGAGHHVVKTGGFLKQCAVPGVLEHDELFGRPAGG